MRVTSLSWAASLIKLKISGFHSVETTCLPSRETKSNACGRKSCAEVQRVFGSCKRRYQHPVRLVAGMTAVETPTSGHPHIANQHRTHAQIAHLATQTLNKHHQIRVTEIATLIGTHDLIMFGLYRQRVSADNTAIRKTAYRLCATRHRLGYFLPRRRCQAGATGKQRPGNAIAVCSFYQRGISVFTSAFCARCRNR